METDKTSRRSVLFVDFDNIYSGLKALDRAAAESFATDPLNWVAWLTRSADMPHTEPRRFLMQVCYLNPNVYSRYRVFFMRSGFRVVDCPPLTTQGKTSADIHIVLDVLDALVHQTRYDEFVIASADADFTPLLYRLRSHDRRTTVVTAGPASAAYRAVCDSVILPDRFAEAVANVASDETLQVESADARGDRGGQPDSPDASSQTFIATAAEAIRAAVAAAPGPLVSGSGAQAALAVYPAITADGWAGAGSFAAFVSRHLPELGWARYPSPGYLYDPARHDESDLPAGGNPLPSLHPVAEQVSRVTGTPRLTTEQYGVLFEELAQDLPAQPFSLTQTTKSVRDRTVSRGVGVSRAAVNFVVQGLIYSGHGLPAGSRAGELALAFADNVRTLCRNAQMELGEHDRTVIQEWLTGSTSRMDPEGSF